MTATPKVSIDSKLGIEHQEISYDRCTFLQNYPLLKDQDEESLAKLEKRVVRKLDWRFLPTVVAMLMMNYLDRINVSNARLAGMQADLGNMSDTTWSTGISMFYVGYILSQVPANVILAKGNPRILLPCFMLAWSVVTTSMVALKSGWAFCLCRFLVGVTEGPFIPAVSLMTSSWYTKSESPLRMSIWHAGNILSNVFSGILAAGILTTMDGIGSYHAWQWFILIEGIASILVGLVSFWGLPMWPHNTGTYFFTAEESEMAQYRQFKSAGGISEDDEGTHWGGVVMAAKDPITWIFAGLHFSLIIAQSFKDFFPSIVDTFGFSEVGTYLVQAPPYVFSFIFTLIISWSVGKYNHNAWHIIGSIIVALVGAVIMISTLERGPRYFSLFLLCAGPFVGLNLQISWETGAVPRPRTKRAALIAIANSVSSVSHWFTPYFFLRSQEPRYQTGGGVIIAGCGLTVVFSLVALWWCTRKNKLLKQREDEAGEPKGWRFPT